MSFCVTFGTYILINPNEEKLIENIKIDDMILGLDENNFTKQYQIDKIIYSNGESIYKIYYENGFIECSESHCIYDSYNKIFKHAYELNPGDSIQGYDQNHMITQIEIFSAKPVIGILLKDNGCYFANKILSHSQNAHPAFVTQSIQSNTETQSATKTSAQSYQSCISLGTKVNISENEVKNVEDLQIGDFVFGPISPEKHATFKIKEKTIISDQIVYAVFCSTSYLECSENHCIFSFSDNTFRKVWQLKTGDFVVTNSGIEVIEKIMAKSVIPVVSIQLENQGCFYANNILSHSQLEPPALDFAIKNPANNVNICYFNNDSSKTNVFSNNVMTSRLKENFIASGVHSNSKIKTEVGEIDIKKLTKEHRLLCLDKALENTISTIDCIVSAEHEVLELNFTDNTSIKLSKYCCIFSKTQNNFVHAFRLRLNEEVYFENSIKILSGIILLGKQKIYSIKLLESGSFYCDGALVHNQDKPINLENESLFKNDEINKIIKPESKSVLPMWKYENGLDWKKAFYLIDFNLRDESAGYSFGGKTKLSVKIDFQIQSHLNQIIMIKIISQSFDIEAFFNMIKIDSTEAISWKIDNSNYYFLKIDSIKTSFEQVTLSFNFSSKNDSLLTNLNFINLDEFQAISNYFQGYQG